MLLYHVAASRSSRARASTDPRQVGVSGRQNLLVPAQLAAGLFHSTPSTAFRRGIVSLTGSRSSAMSVVHLALIAPHRLHGLRRWFACLPSYSRLDRRLVPQGRLFCSQLSPRRSPIRVRRSSEALMRIISGFPITVDQGADRTPGPSRRGAQVADATVAANPDRGTIRELAAATAVQPFVKLDGASAHICVRRSRHFEIPRLGQNVLTFLGSCHQMEAPLLCAASRLAVTRT